MMRLVLGGVNTTGGWDGRRGLVWFYCVVCVCVCGKLGEVVINYYGHFDNSVSGN